MNFDTDLLSPMAWERAKVVVLVLLVLVSAFSLIIAFGAIYKVLKVRARVHTEAPVVFIVPLH